jgi:hypothetical protein
MDEDNLKYKWEELNYEVERAIKNRKASDVDFSTKDVYQCKYQQKYAEIENSEYSFIFSLIIFMLGGGIGLISRFRTDDPTSIVSSIFGLVLIYIAWGIIYKT